MTRPCHSAPAGGRKFRAGSRFCEPAAVLFRSLTEIERVIRASWSRETCDPVDFAVWSPENPSRGQCAVTALVVQDLCGGELLLAEVHFRDGSRQGLHYWNRLGGGVELDLTRAQFAPDEAVQAPEPVERPTDLSRGRLYPQYQALSRVVRAGLGGEILHLTTRSAWEAASASGRYAPPSLAAEGFIHFSDAAQVARVAAARFAGVPDLVLLCVPVDRLDAPLRYETSDAGAERFPHLYGPLAVGAVARVVPFDDRITR
jgi:uncharacterized protein (DUF952 family)